MDPADSSSDTDSSSSEFLNWSLISISYFDRSFLPIYFLSFKNRHVDDSVREAISTINDGNGVDIDGIYEFVKVIRVLIWWEWDTIVATLIQKEFD